MSISAIRVLRPLAALLVAASILGSAHQAKAADGLQDPLAGPELSVSWLKKGQRSPFDGYVLAGDGLVRWRLRLEKLQFQLDSAQVHQTALREIQGEFCGRQIEIESELGRAKVKLHQLRIEELAADLADARNVGFFEKPSVWFATGLIVGVLAVVIPAVAL